MACFGYTNLLDTHPEWMKMEATLSSRNFLRGVDPVFRNVLISHGGSEASLCHAGFTAFMIANPCDDDMI